MESLVLLRARENEATSFADMDHRSPGGAYHFSNFYTSPSGASGISGARACPSGRIEIADSFTPGTNARLVSAELQVLRQRFFTHR